jgi:hypothetical protein
MRMNPGQIPLLPTRFAPISNHPAKEKFHFDLLSMHQLKQPSRDAPSVSHPLTTKIRANPNPPCPPWLKVFPPQKTKKKAARKGRQSKSLITDH